MLDRLLGRSKVAPVPREERDEAVSRSRAITLELEALVRAIQREDDAARDSARRR